MSLLHPLIRCRGLIENSFSSVILNREYASQSAQHIRSRSIPFAMTAAFILLLALFQTTQAHAFNGSEKLGTSCGFSDAAFDPTTDVHAFTAYQDAIAELLKQEQFDELDCLADAARASKAKFSGGTWKLVEIYLGLESPRPGHPTHEDWNTHLQLVEKWTHHNPESITAHIALAESHVEFAWDARGDGYADSVSDSGWKIFSEQMDEAKSILDDASTLKAKCPEWYLAMEQVAQGQTWDLPRFKALVDQAIASEPTFAYYYRVYAFYLQPKWAGEEGDPARFAEEAANKIGGDAGDALYFQIANKIVCGCKDPEFMHFSWPRLQKGFAALEKLYGVSLVNVNSYGLMAVNNGDWVIADTEFKRIGDNWDKDTWQTEAWFKQNRDSAAQVAPLQLRTRAFHEEAEANMKSPAGETYRKNLDPKLTAFEQECISEANSDPSKFDLFLQVGKDGSAEEAHTEKRPTAFGTCVMKAIYATYVKKETPFPPPPGPSYKMILEVDPATLHASAN
jgi:hypothetical protein